LVKTAWSGCDFVRRTSIGLRDGERDTGKVERGRSLVLCTVAAARVAKRRVRTRRVEAGGKPV